MKNTIIKGNGKSRRIVAPTDMPSTYDEFRSMAISGNAYFDVLLNDAGCDQVGTPLSKETLLDNDTADAFELAREGATPNEAFLRLAKKIDLDAKFIYASGTSNAIVVSPKYFELLDGQSLTFVAKFDNSGKATTLNVYGLGAKPLYKAGTTSAPTIKAGKAYTVWYSTSGNCFFVKASASGTATAADVLAGETFSNDEDTDIAGTHVCPKKSISAGGNLVRTYADLIAIPPSSPSDQTFKDYYQVTFASGITGTVRLTIVFEPINSTNLKYKIHNGEGTDIVESTPVGGSSTTITKTHDIAIQDSGKAVIACSNPSSTGAGARIVKITVGINGISIVGGNVLV
jgi:hypothetical protein